MWCLSGEGGGGGVVCRYSEPVEGDRLGRGVGLMVAVFSFSFLEDEMGWRCWGGVSCWSVMKGG